jgi:N-acetylated-alpha-linked acidic dipeptidase
MHNLTLSSRSIPDATSAAATSRQFTSTPHMAGTEDDLRTAKDLLTIIQTELGILPPKEEPIFDAGSDASRRATTGIRDLKGPSAWIDTYYPLLNAPTGKSTLEILDDKGKAVWKAHLPEKVPKQGSSPIEYKFANAIPPFHGYSKNGTGQVNSFRCLCTAVSDSI